MTKAPPTIITVFGQMGVRVKHSKELHACVNVCTCGQGCVYATQSPHSHKHAPCMVIHTVMCIHNYGSSFLYITCTYGDATGVAELALIIKSGKVTANIQALGERKTTNSGSSLWHIK